MSDYAKICEELRGRYIAFDCTGNHKYAQLFADAAAAIEALEAEVSELKRVNMEIFDDLPKRGEWFDKADEIDKQFGRHLYVCSLCGKQPDFFIGGTEDWWPSKKPNYCPNCGAKMEVQDGKD